jgi:hypothetical protein
MYIEHTRAIVFAEMGKISLNVSMGIIIGPNAFVRILNVHAIKVGVVFLEYF